MTKKESGYYQAIWDEVEGKKHNNNIYKPKIKVKKKRKLFTKFILLICILYQMLKMAAYLSEIQVINEETTFYVIVTVLEIIIGIIIINYWRTL